MQGEQIHEDLLEEIERRSGFGRIRQALARFPSSAGAPDPSGPRILFVCPWLAVGGAELVALEIIKGLQPEFRFAIATTLDQDNPAEARFRELTPFIYHLGRLGERGARGFLPRIVARHGIRCVVVNWSQAGYEASPALKSITGGVWVGDIIHNAVPEGWIGHAIRYDRYIDRHFAVGPAPAVFLADEGKIDSNKICLARNGIDVSERFNPANYQGRLGAIRAELDIEDSSLVVSFVGRLSQEKDPGLLVKAIVELTQQDPPRPVTGLIVGDGEQRASVERLIAETGMADVIKILGLRDDVGDVLAISDYLLLTSRIEGAPLSPLEALSMGVAVVSTDVGNMREVVTNGANGWVVDSRDPAEIARRVIDFETAPGALAEAARASVVDRFDVSQMVDVYRREFRAALAAYNP